jgi:hypothetical protein
MFVEWTLDDGGMTMSPMEVSMMRFTKTYRGLLLAKLPFWSSAMKIASAVKQAPLLKKQEK